MLEKINIKPVLFCIVMMSLFMVVSCGKKTPGPGDTGDRAGISETEAAEAEKAAMEREKRQAAIEEQEIQARQKAEQEARQKAEQARDQFVNEKLYFGFDDSSLTPEARNVLRAKVQWLRANPDQCVLVEGHCDERGTDEYNLALGSRRAESVKDFMVKAGIDASRLTTISYGEERPAVAGRNEDAWAKNRRAEFKFTSCR
jgi:peptidoglycan-associated lipoprotein